ncbi:hypothetical protein ABE137_21890 [Brevibacillus laterosporus]|uniref:YolD-like family protein n=1 Tax=Brevibacillus laterosporus TaxID=1465 RepID=UPI003D232243
MASKILDPLVTKFICLNTRRFTSASRNKKLIEKTIIEEDELAEFCYRISHSR